MPLPFPFDWKRPDYLPVLEWRTRRLDYLRRNPAEIPKVRAYYRLRPWQMITDWGMTTDPRNVELGIPVLTPFLLFPKQEEWCEWMLERWRSGDAGVSGLTEKSRDSGVSWLAVSMSCVLCLQHDRMVVGFGSRKQEYVDQLGNPKSLLEKARVFMSTLPPEFRGGWDARYNGAHNLITFPGTLSHISGEVGDSIGRGDRTSIYFVDEAAFLEHPLLADSGLSGTTRCRLDISTPNGLGNPFALKRRKLPKHRVFTFHWRHDPRKDQAWYDNQRANLTEEIVASDIDISYAGSVTGLIIPAAWVTEAIGAAGRLGVEPTGMVRAGFDVADQGRDANAFAVMRGAVLTHLESWSGQGGDIFQSVQRVFGLCDEHGAARTGFHYDADGLGAGVRGDANQINEQRKAMGPGRAIEAYPFQGSGAVYDPQGELVPERSNEDFFANLKAQCWWALRLRFRETHRALSGMPYDRDLVICIDPALPELDELQMELSQPTYKLNAVGKVVIDKAPEGSASPNLADAVMIAASPELSSDEVWKRLGAAA